MTLRRNLKRKESRFNTNLSKLNIDYLLNLESATLVKAVLSVGCVLILLISIYLTLASGSKPKESGTPQEEPRPLQYWELLGP